MRAVLAIVACFIWQFGVAAPPMSADAPVANAPTECCCCPSGEICVCGCSVATEEQETPRTDAFSLCSCEEIPNGQPTVGRYHVPQPRRIAFSAFAPEHSSSGDSRGITPNQEAMYKPPPDLAHISTVVLLI